MDWPSFWKGAFWATTIWVIVDALVLCLINRAVNGLLAEWQRYVGAK